MLGLKKLQKGIYYDIGSYYDSKELVELEYFIKLATCLRKKFNNLKGSYSILPDIIIFSCISNKNKPRSFVRIKNKSSQKKYFLFIISCERGYDSSKVSQYYDVVYQAYLRRNNLTKNIYPLPVGIPNFNFFQKKIYSLSSQKKIKLFFSGNLNKNRVDLFSKLYSVGIVKKIYIKILIFLKLRIFLKKEIEKTRIKKNIKDNIIFFNNNFNTGLKKTQFLIYFSKTYF